VRAHLGLIISDSFPRTQITFVLSFTQNFVVVCLVHAKSGLPVFFGAYLPLSSNVPFPSSSPLILIFSSTRTSSAWAELARCIGSRFQRATRDHRSSPPRSSRPPEKQIEDRTAEFVSGKAFNRIVQIGLASPCAHIPHSSGHPRFGLKTRTSHQQIPA
jgi:hypothetical protein